MALLLNSFADQAMEEELKKRNSMKSKLKWISSTRKLARLQNAFKGQRIGPDAGSRKKLFVAFIFFKGTLDLMNKLVSFLKLKVFKGINM